MMEEEEGSCSLPCFPFSSSFLRISSLSLFCFTDAHREEFFEVCQKGELKRAQELVSKISFKDHRSFKGDVSRVVCLRDKMGRTPLHYACMGGYVRLALFLINHGAPVAPKFSSLFLFLIFLSN